jgi:4-hydroxy-tetrahydrodipicolinate reductase
MKIAVLGANGRMGRAVVRLARDAGDEVVCAVGVGEEGRDVGELAGLGAIGVKLGSSIDAIEGSGAEAVIDFSTPAATMRGLEVCARAGLPFVSGTTGLDEEQKRAFASAGRKIAVVWEPNMSVGVHVLALLVEKAVASLGPGYDVEVVETHHKKKIDAPSGTALRLGDVVKNARNGRYVHGREGKPGAREADEIGMHAMRGGDVVGDHTVYFFGEGERIELTHRASSRDLFAHGALRAARWIRGRAPGKYGLAAVLDG